MKIVPECRFIKPNGLKCQSAALRGSSFCYHHARIHISPRRPRRNKEDVLNLPLLGDPRAAVPFINELVQAVASNNIGARRAGSLLYMFQIARKNS